jgi:hypothetical protein
MVFYVTLLFVKPNNIANSFVNSSVLPILFSNTLFVWPKCYSPRLSLINLWYIIQATFKKSWPNVAETCAKPWHNV